MFVCSENCYNQSSGKMPENLVLCTHTFKACAKNNHKRAKQRD